MSERRHEDWVDCWKGLLIFLVVAGHCFGAVSHYVTGVSFAVCDDIYKLIYFFHMPAFFWVMGYCWHPSMDSLIKFAKKKARRLLVPYVVFGVASCFVLLLGQAFILRIASGADDGYYASHGVEAAWQPFLSLVHAGGWPNGRGFLCNSVLWFLPAMFSCGIAYWALDRFVKSKARQLVVAGILLVAYFWLQRLPAWPWGLSHVPHYLPYVICGRWLRVPERMKGCRWVWLLVIGWLGLAIFAVVSPDVRRGYWFLGWHLTFVLAAIGGIGLSVLTARQLTDRCWLLWGRCSLGIMLVHKFLVVPFQVAAKPLLSSGLCSALLVTLVSVVAITMASAGVTVLIGKVAPWTLGERGKV